MGERCEEQIAISWECDRFTFLCIHSGLCRHLVWRKFLSAARKRGNYHKREFVSPLAGTNVISCLFTAVFFFRTKRKTWRRLSSAGHEREEKKKERRKSNYWSEHPENSSLRATLDVTSSPANWNNFYPLTSLKSFSRRSGESPLFERPWTRMRPCSEVTCTEVTK